MIRKIICVKSVLVILLAVIFLLYPAFRAALNTCDPALRQPGIPKSAWRLYLSLTPRYAAWAKERVAHGQPQKLSTENISGTEWPLFGSVFYLWAMENLQAAWESGALRAGAEPKVFAKDAIISASELVVDPKHATWVKIHWGENYLHRENVFYRMMVIAALTSRQKLLHDGFQVGLLRDQVESLSKELEASTTGLLHDYPGECYPADVMAAVMCIKRADVVLGTDHSEFINRSVRAFSGTALTRQQLPPYAANGITGAPLTDARGCGNSYVCLTAPELWPVQAKKWFELHDQLFWQSRITAVGFREYPKDNPHSDWTANVDAGPVIAGHGVAASAFGIGAARKNGRFDRAYPLATEMLATVLELPTGMLAIPRLLSNLSDAPFLGEAAILWQMTIQPEKGVALSSGGEIPWLVHIVLLSLVALGGWSIYRAARTFRRALLSREIQAPLPRLQVILWMSLMLGAGIAAVSGFRVIALSLLLLNLLLPLAKVRDPRRSAPRQ